MEAMACSCDLHKGSMMKSSTITRTTNNLSNKQKNHNVVGYISTISRVERTPHLSHLEIFVPPPVLVFMKPVNQIITIIIIQAIRLYFTISGENQNTMFLRASLSLFAQRTQKNCRQIRKILKPTTGKTSQVYTSPCVRELTRYDHPSLYYSTMEKGVLYPVIVQCDDRKGGGRVNFYDVSKAVDHCYVIFNKSGFLIHMNKNLCAELLLNNQLLNVFH